MSTTTGAIGMHHRIRSRNWPNGGCPEAGRRQSASRSKRTRGTPPVVGNARNLMVELDRAFDRTQAYVDRLLPQAKWVRWAIWSLSVMVLLTIGIAITSSSRLRIVILANDHASVSTIHPTWTLAMQSSAERSDDARRSVGAGYFR